MVGGELHPKKSLYLSEANYVISHNGGNVQFVVSH